MPVRDLTDRPRQMPRLGKIRLGDQSGNGGSPKNLPHFVVPDEVAAVYGPNPTELPIVFLSDDEEVIASSYYRAYNASNGLVCKGDGFMANAMLDAAVLHRSGGALNQPLDINVWAHGATRGADVPATKDVVRQEIDCWGAGYGDLPPCPMFALKKCAVRTFFQFAIYGVPGLGVYQMDTGSVINVGRMLGTLAMARTVLGGISGVPMILSREKTDVAPTGTKHGVWTVNLRIDTKFSLTEVLKLRSGPVANALLPPVDESEVYEHIDEDEPVRISAPHEAPQETRTRAESPDAAASAPGASPAPSPKPVPVGDVPELLNAIKERHGQEAKVAAINIMSRFYDTQVVTKLNHDEREEYAALLRVRLDGIEHEHEGAFTAYGHPVCRICGDDVKPPEGAETEAPAQQPSLVT